MSTFTTPWTGRLHPWWQRVPLRTRLLGILVVLLLAALTVTGVGAQFVLRRYLVGKLNEQLISVAADRGAMRMAANQILAGDAVQPGTAPGRLLNYALKLSHDDGTAQASQLVDGSQPNLPTMTYQAAAALNSRVYTVESLRGRDRWQAIALPIEYQDGTFGSLQIALSQEDVNDATRQMLLLVVGFGLLGSLLCLVLGWQAIRRQFRPLTEVEHTAAAIAAGDLTRRVPDYPSSTEVGRLTTALNGMLAQIESAFRAQEASEARTRRFAADASHELRTPLASIRGFAELYRQGAVREPDDVARTMGRIEGEAQRMGLLVEDLLLLARLDEQRPSRTDPVDLAVLAGDACHDARGLAPDRTVRLVGLREDSGPGSAHVTGDDARLRQVVANLVANAVRHTPAGSPVEIAVGTARSSAPDVAEQVAVLEVRDHGPGLSPEHAAKVFERFYRVDSSRNRGQGGGSGLGLSIVAAVVAAHGGRVGVSTTPGGGATFRVELPQRAAVGAQLP